MSCINQLQCVVQVLVVYGCMALLLFVVDFNVPCFRPHLTRFLEGTERINESMICYRTLEEVLEASGLSQEQGMLTS